MSDTLQYVDWHLQRACPFRQGDAIHLLEKAFQATAHLRLIDDMTDKGNVYGDVCITSVSYSKDWRGPSGGFRISDAVAPAGDLATARHTCATCAVNALAPTKMAGCCGLLSVDADDPSVDAALHASIHGGLASEFSAAFLSCDPLWYGLWINSPLTQSQLRLLPSLLQNVHARRGLELEQFRRACSLALEHGIELHVRMPPPGHTDFGFYTVFPHCPRCKQRVGERWKTPSDQMTTCRTCGQQFIPAATGSSEADDFETANLKDQLSAEEYATVCEAWKQRHGSDPHPIAAILGRDPYAVSKSEPKASSGPTTLLDRMRRWFRR